jgi:hypothetical protein
MDGTVIHNPKDTAGIVVGWSRHYLLDQSIKWRNSVVGFAPAENSGVVDIQSAEINPCSTALVPILDPSRPTRLAWLSWMETATGLNASLLIR